MLWNPSLGLRFSVRLDVSNVARDREFTVAVANDRTRCVADLADEPPKGSNRVDACRHWPKSRGPHPWPWIAVFPSFTLRVNETAAELAFVPRSAMRCSRRARSTPRPPATPEAGPPDTISRPRSLAEEVDQQDRGAGSRSEDRGPVS